MYKPPSIGLRPVFGILNSKANRKSPHSNFYLCYAYRKLPVGIFNHEYVTFYTVIQTSRVDIETTKYFRIYNHLKQHRRLPYWLFLPMHTNALKKDYFVSLESGNANAAIN